MTYALGKHCSIQLSYEGGWVILNIVITQPDHTNVPVSTRRT